MHYKLAKKLEEAGFPKMPKKTFFKLSYLPSVEDLLTVVGIDCFKFNDEADYEHWYELGMAIRPSLGLRKTLAVLWLKLKS